MPKDPVRRAGAAAGSTPLDVSAPCPVIILLWWLTQDPKTRQKAALGSARSGCVVLPVGKFGLRARAGRQGWQKRPGPGDDQRGRRTVPKYWQD